VRIGVKIRRRKNAVDRPAGGSQGSPLQEDDAGGHVLSPTHFRRDLHVVATPPGMKRSFSEECMIWGRDQLPARPDLSCSSTFHVNKRSVYMKACISPYQERKLINHGRAEAGPYPGRRVNKNVSRRSWYRAFKAHPAPGGGAYLCVSSDEDFSAFFSSEATRRGLSQRPIPICSTPSSSQARTRPMI
jgi:hypothetical protein